MSEQYVIGEGVILDTRPASFLSRALSTMLDFVIYGLAMSVTFIVIVATETLAEGYEAQVIICTLVFFLVLLPALVESLSRGRSVGKLALGISVVRDDGGPITFRHSFIRALVGFLELYMTFGAVAIVASLSNDRGKRLGDLLAGSYVIRVRARKIRDTELVIPPPLMQWISNAEISKFPDGLGLAARDFLERRFAMTPHARAIMANDFSQKLSEHVAPAPPFPVPPEEYITAVVAERARREGSLEATRLSRAQRVQERMDTLPFGVEQGS